jgi:hypothetical protein
MRLWPSGADRRAIAQKEANRHFAEFRKQEQEKKKAHVGMGSMSMRT